MEETLNTFLSPAWWITAFAAGIIINLVSTYLKPLLDAALAHISKSRRAANQKRVDEVAKEVSFYLHHSTEVPFLLHMEIRRRQQATFFFLVEFLCLATLSFMSLTLREVNFGVIVGLAAFSLFAIMIAAATYAYTSSAIRVAEVVAKVERARKETCHAGGT